ncbi:MAG: type IV pilus secretin PilQ, partial [Methylococcales bacterium]
IPVRQVMIEARIVIADTSFAQEIGARFGVVKADTSNVVTANNLNNGVFFVPSEPVDKTDSKFLVDLAARAIKAHPVGALGMTLARGADYVLNLELSALENENRGEVLANPRVMTSDRELAFIKQGVQIPFTTVSQNGTQTEFIDAVLELNVRPQITPDGDVIMELLIKKDDSNGEGGIDKREIETIVRIKDGETVVLGGVYDNNSAKEEFKIPFFGDLPGIGFLFKNNTKSDRKSELLIFVTPKIVKNTLATR